MTINKKIMKTILLYAAASIVGGSGFYACAQQTDPVKKANEANEKKADNKVADEDVAECLVKSADARMMGSREGTLATKKGTTSSIREYGQLMISDQSMLLEKIKALALKHNITLPTGISDKKESGREDLAAKDGKDFDEKFIKMMTIDHERDIKLFKKSIKFKNKEVSTFAQTYLPLIQSHLDKIITIKQASKK